MRVTQLLLLSTTLGLATGFTVETPAATTIYEVCLSPGCIADGAKETLQKLQALAPPGNLVMPGVCCSLCGNGPVVMNPGVKTTTKHRRVKDKKILDLLLSEEDIVIPDELIKGYDASMEAADAFQKQDFEKAVTLYEAAIESGFQAAMDLETAREKAGEKNLADSGIPVGLLWLVEARRNEALARMEVGDSDGAVLAAQAACNIARNRCSESLEVLAEVYQKKGDDNGELQALTNLFDLPVEKDLPMQVANKRRELGFRKAKLEREAAA